MTLPVFVPFPKITRLNREIVVTEKIDGTNASVHVLEDGTVLAASRNRDPVHLALARLAREGSLAAPGFVEPEGVVVFHVASRTLFKVLLRGDELHKGATEAT